jgi:hypothetical protein
MSDKAVCRKKRSDNWDCTTTVLTWRN